MMFLNILIAAIAASLFLLCVTTVVALGQLNRICSACNQLVDLMEQRVAAVRRHGPDHDYDPERPQS